MVPYHAWHLGSNPLVFEEECEGGDLLNPARPRDWELGAGKQQTKQYANAPMRAVEKGLQCDPQLWYLVLIGQKRTLVFTNYHTTVGCLSYLGVFKLPVTSDFDPEVSIVGHCQAASCYIVKGFDWVVADKGKGRFLGIS